MTIYITLLPKLPLNYFVKLSWVKLLNKKLRGKTVHVLIFKTYLQAFEVRTIRWLLYSLWIIIVSIFKVRTTWVWAGERMREDEQKHLTIAKRDEIIK